MPSWKDSYGPPDQFEEQDLDELAEDDLKSLLPTQFTAMQAGGWQRFNILSLTKPAAGDPSGAGTESALDAYYSKTAIVILKMYRKFDTTPQSKALPLAELIVQGAEGAGMKPTSIIHYSIENDETVSFMAQAVKAMNGKGGKATLDLASTGTELQWFQTLLGSDNGRTAQQMCNFHSTYFGGKAVTTINILNTHILEFVIG